MPTSTPVQNIHHSCGAQLSGLVPCMHGSSLSKWDLCGTNSFYSLLILHLSPGPFPLFTQLSGLSPHRLTVTSMHLQSFIKISWLKIGFSFFVCVCALVYVWPSLFKALGWGHRNREDLTVPQKVASTVLTKHRKDGKERQQLGGREAPERRNHKERKEGSRPHTVAHITVWVRESEGHWPYSPFV